jgi:hypothetical protein
MGYAKLHSPQRGNPQDLTRFHHRYDAVDDAPGMIGILQPLSARVDGGAKKPSICTLIMCRCPSSRSTGTSEGKDERRTEVSPIEARNNKRRGENMVRESAGFVKTANESSKITSLRFFNVHCFELSTRDLSQKSAS